MERETREEIGRLIKSIAEGNEDAIADIYEKVGRIMHTIARMYLRDTEEAKDVVQDSLITIVRKAKLYREDRNAYAWITTIVKNTAINRYNKIRRRKETPLEKVSYSASSESPNDISFHMRFIFAQLDKKERDLLIYYYWNRLSMDEIAQILHISKSTVKHRIDKLLEKIREMIKN